MVKFVQGAVAAAAFLMAADAAHAQVAAVPPMVSAYTVPPHGVYLPPTMRMTWPNYPPVSYYPIPNQWVAYAAPSAMIVAPARVSFGPFGGTYVRTPYYRVRF